MNKYQEKELERGQPFRERLKKNLRSYQQYIESRKEFSDVTEDVKKFIDVLDEVVRSYLKGKIISALNTFSRWWQRNEKENFLLYQCNPEIEFYRIRKKGNNPFRREDLFHVPFDKRGKLGNYRYSISGFPCLYLGRSIYACWEETRRPPLDSFFISRVKLSEGKTLELLDLRVNQQREDYELRKYLVMLPLIIACSMRNWNEENTFVAEYIIQQILMQSLMRVNGEKPSFDGVIYTSSVVDNSFGFVSTNTDLQDCVAIPVQKVKENGFCENLSSIFELSAPICYEYELIQGFSPLKWETATETGNTYKSSYFSLLEERLREKNDCRQINAIS